MKRVLVTGVGGFIGSHLAQALLDRGDAVLGLDNFCHGDRGNIDPFAEHAQFESAEGDVRDLVLLEDLCRQVDAVVHLAAWKIPRYGQARETLEVDGLGTWTVLKAAAERKLRTVVASTSDIYGKNPQLPFHEESDSVLGPSTVRRWGYAVSKLFGEHLCWAFHREAGLPVTVVRYFGGYGPRQRMDWMGGPQGVFITQALKGESLPIHGAGEQRRTFTYISDHVDGTLRALDSEKAVGEAFNIGSTQDIGIRELAELIVELTESSSKIEYVPYESFGAKYEDVQRRVPNMDKARTLLGFQAQVKLRDGLQQLIAWYRQRTAEGVTASS